jgi:CBS domain-containing protein
VQIQDLLHKTHRNLITIDPDETAEAAAEVLTTNNIGALPVCDRDGRLVGILSERDIVHGLSKRGGGIAGVQVSELMSPKVVTCGPRDDVGNTMAVMSEGHFRHIPVLVEGRPAAMISSRDVMEALLEKTEAQRDVFANAYEMVR